MSEPPRLDVYYMDRGRQIRGVLDSWPEYGYVCVVGLRGFHGSKSCRIEDISLDPGQQPRQAWKRKRAFLHGMVRACSDGVWVDQRRARSLPEEPSNTEGD